jgi:hypothetical protein
MEKFYFLGLEICPGSGDISGSALRYNYTKLDPDSMRIQNIVVNLLFSAQRE